MKYFKNLQLNTLKLNNYAFDGDLHKFTLQSLIHKKYDVFEDLILNGIYDDNYDIYNINITYKKWSNHEY